ncbi:hypothetical protein MIH18_02040 [Marinobacter sp. M3C]|uniref:hypothetical protein n=1 Tax=Marinobacter sp. M3C TaxID=2917715 RepID=UPI00200BB86B|nr:hypothetical protein [Marinobacter sp. M3C]UQG60762.1 hypothetical protein MIH18_02040 [Marinobacter sp. M3C]
MYLVLTWIFVTGALLPIVLFAWYLAWPVTSGVVTRVDEWMQPTNDVLRAKKRRSVSYEYEWQGSKRTGTRQSLFLAHGLSPKKQVGDTIDVSVCSIVPEMTCPRRPWFELFIVLIWSAFISGAAFVALLEHVLKP